MLDIFFLAFCVSDVWICIDMKETFRYRNFDFQLTWAWKEFKKYKNTLYLVLIFDMLFFFYKNLVELLFTYPANAKMLREATEKAFFSGMATKGRGGR